MRAFGIDVGTTKICVAVIDTATGTTVCVKSENNAFLPGKLPFEKIQSPKRILNCVQKLLKEAIAEAGKPDVIGVAGQMHGILYLDANGIPLSPLYTWQDTRGDEPYRNEKTYVQTLAECGCGNIAAGYGCATHFYNAVNHIVPAGSAKICTIHDYVAMTLCEKREPLMHSSDAASLGLFDLGTFSYARDLPFDRNILDPVTNEAEILGRTPDGVPVAVAIGDNQASFLGSVEKAEGSVLLNIGTGSQISACCRYGGTAPHGIEQRPLNGDLCLWVGASLCGGRAFALLENFFRQVLRMCGNEPEGNLYDAMQKVAEGVPESSLHVSTLFAGTREDPALRGSITGIDTANFTPENLINGFLDGMVSELSELYQKMLSGGLPAGGALFGAGNGIRKNPLMRDFIAKRFGMKPILSAYLEEGASGAAKFACHCIASKLCP